MTVSQNDSMESGLYGQQIFFREDIITKHVKSQLFGAIPIHVLHISAELSSIFSKRYVRALFHFQTLPPSQLQYLIDMHLR